MKKTHNARVGIKPIKTHEEASRICSHILRKHGKVPGSNSINIHIAISPKPGVFSKKNALQARKNRVLFLELVFSVTQMSPKNGMATSYSRLCQQFLEEIVGKDLELVCLVTHLDQGSIHAHALLKIIDKPWSKLIDEIANPVFYKRKNKILQKFQDTNLQNRLLQRLTREEKMPYFILTKLWHDFIGKVLKQSGIILQPLQRDTARNYKELRYFKEASKQLQYDLNEFKQQKQHFLTSLPLLKEQQILDTTLSDLTRSNDSVKQEIAQLTSEILALQKKKGDLRKSLAELKGDDDDLKEIKRIFNKS